MGLMYHFTLHDKTKTTKADQRDEDFYETSVGTPYVKAIAELIPFFGYFGDEWLKGEHSPDDIYPSEPNEIRVPVSVLKPMAYELGQFLSNDPLDALQNQARRLLTEGKYDNSYDADQHWKSAKSSALTESNYMLDDLKQIYDMVNTAAENCEKYDVWVTESV